MSTNTLNNVTTLFNAFYDNQSNQNCFYCSKISKWRGWDNLCNRTCYYGLCDLLNSYENGEVENPDERLIKYFTKYRVPTHSFIFDKLKQFLNIIVI